MHLASKGRSAGILLASLALLLGLAIAPASAHDHPTSVELDAPAVVNVKTYARVFISLIEAHAQASLGLEQHTYEIEMVSGSGFAVDPNGTVVTAGNVITPDLKKAAIYAVNKIFSDRYGANARPPRDPFTKQRIKNLSNNPINDRLQRCYQYNTTDRNGGCLVTAVPFIRVFPWVADQKKYGSLAADVLWPPRGQTDAVGVLKIGASSMPTVSLAKGSSGTAFTVLGFSEIPTAKSASQQQLIGHFDKDGGPIKKDEFIAKLGTGLQAGGRGGPLVEAKTGQVIGFLSVPGDVTTKPGPVTPTFVDAPKIRKVLEGISVEPRRGPTDAVFEAAMHDFKNKLYKTPIPSFERTLELYPGHALATEYLAVAKQKQGTAEDLTGKVGSAAGASGGGGFPFRLLILIVPAILLLALGVIVGIRRRQGGQDGEGAPPQAPAPPPGVPARVGAPPAQGPRPPVAAAPRPPTDGKPRPPGAPPRPTPPGSKAAAAAPARPPTGAKAATPAGQGAKVGTLSQSTPPGSPETRPAFCTQCGKHIGPGHAFCGYCGTPVG